MKKHGVEKMAARLIPVRPHSRRMSPSTEVVHRICRWPEPYGNILRCSNSRFSPRLVRLDGNDWVITPPEWKPSSSPWHEYGSEK